MTDSIRYRPDDVRWFDQQVREPNIALEAAAIRQDMDNALTLSPLEVVLIGEAIQEGRTRFYQEEAQRALTITEAPCPYETPEPLMTWRSVLFSAVMALWFNNWTRRLMIALAYAVAVGAVVGGAHEIAKLLAGVR